MNWMEKFKQRIEKKQHEVLENKELPINLQSEPAIRPQLPPKAVATDIKLTVKKAQWGLESLLDELLGNGWEEMGKEELLRLAEINYIQWQETNSGESKIVAGVIWELTGNVKKIEQLGYVTPWWYDNQ